MHNMVWHGWIRSVDTLSCQHRDTGDVLKMAGFLPSWTGTEGGVRRKNFATVPIGMQGLQCYSISTFANLPSWFRDFAGWSALCWWYTPTLLMGDQVHSTHVLANLLEAVAGLWHRWLKMKSSKIEVLCLRCGGLGICLPVSAGQHWCPLRWWGA